MRVTHGRAVRQLQRAPNAAKAQADRVCSRFPGCARRHRLRGSEDDRRHTTRRRTAWDQGRRRDLRPRGQRPPLRARWQRSPLRGRRRGPDLVRRRSRPCLRGRSRHRRVRLRARHRAAAASAASPARSAAGTATAIASTAASGRTVVGGPGPLRRPDGAGAIRAPRGLSGRSSAAEPSCRVRRGVLTAEVSARPLRGRGRRRRDRRRRPLLRRRRAGRGAPSSVDRRNVRSGGNSPGSFRVQTTLDDGGTRYECGSGVVPFRGNRW